MTQALLLMLGTSLPFIFSYVVGLVVGRRTKRPEPEPEHAHVWTLWELVVGTKDQERVCLTCGFIETTKGPEKRSVCPPHDWTKWRSASLVSGAGGQARDCRLCGIQELRSVTTVNKGIK